MIHDTDQLRDEIEVSRGQLSDDINALAEEAKPATLLRRRAHQIKSKLSDVKERVTAKATEQEPAESSARSPLSTVTGIAARTPATIKRAARAKPLVAVAVAFGIGWSIGSILTARRTRRRQPPELMEQVRPLARKASKEAKRAIKVVKGEFVR